MYLDLVLLRGISLDLGYVQDDQWCLYIVFFFVHESCIGSMFSSVSTLAPPYLNFNLQPRVVSEIIYLFYNYFIYF